MYPAPPYQLLRRYFFLLVPISLVVCGYAVMSFLDGGVGVFFVCWWGRGAGGCSPEVLT